MTRNRFSASRRQWLRQGGALAVLASAGGLAACQKAEPSFHATDVTTTDIGAGWTMPDLEGRERSIGDFSGKVVAVFFGFVHCPDICPTTMAELSHVKENLGDEGNRFQTLFVTVDPERDTPEIMRAYLDAFDDTAIGLRGDVDQLAAMAKAFKVFYAKVPQSEGNYTMDHSSGLYLFGPDGRIRLYASYGQPVDELTSDVRRLLAEG